VARHSVRENPALAALAPQAACGAAGLACTLQTLAEPLRSPRLHPLSPPILTALRPPPLPTATGDIGWRYWPVKGQAARRGLPTHPSFLLRSIDSTLFRPRSSTHLTSSASNITPPPLLAPFLPPPPPSTSLLSRPLPACCDIIDRVGISKDISLL
jgi:hypothetical protein